MEKKKIITQIVQFGEKGIYRLEILENGQWHTLGISNNLDGIKNLARIWNLTLPGDKK